MSIDLNDTKFLSNRLTKEQLLAKYSDYEIFKYYLGDFEVGETYRSPLRTDDKIPSFNIFYSKQYNCLLFKDFAGKRGDCIRFVQYLLSLPTYQDAIKQIDLDMSSNKIQPKKENKYIIGSEKAQSDIKIVVRDFSKSDLLFWKSFGINEDTLKKYNVVAIKGYYLDNFYIETKGTAFAYIEYKDNKLTYKIYRPFADKENKWRTNHPYGVHQGYIQLPHSGDLLIITKSLKDVMSIWECTNISSVGIQSESTFIKDSVMDEYKFRFDRVVTLFDNDRQGISQAERYKKIYDIPSIFIPTEYNVKDFSDLVKTYGRKFATEILLKVLKDE